MGFFSSTIGAIGGLFEEAGAAVGDVVEDIGTAVLGPAGQRGERIGTAAGAYLESQGVRGATGIGRTLGGALSADISAAPDIARERARRNQDQIEEVSTAPITEQDYRNLQRGRQIMDEGTMIEIIVPSEPRTAGLPDIYKDPRAIAIGAATGAGMEFLEQVGEYFFGDDDNAGAQTSMMMCKPQQAAFNVNRQTGCITITRKQQAKLKEAVRMFGGPAVAKNLNISNQMLQNLLLKTFRARRKGISGADIRAVKRVDRQMHSLACALGGISQTSRAVAAKKAPPKRSC